MKRWCQLNRARVAHNVHPALLSYQNKCSKPRRSHHSSDICYGARKCYASVYTTIPRTGIYGVDMTSANQLGSTSSCRAYTTVYVCHSVGYSLNRSKRDGRLSSTGRLTLYLRSGRLSTINRASGKVRQPETDVLNTEPRRLDHIKQRLLFIHHEVAEQQLPELHINGCWRFRVGLYYDCTG